MEPTVLEVEDLTKRYGDRTVVDGLTMTLPAGVVAGFIGPNGAGKTTTMAMLLGLVRPSAGRGKVLGASLERPEAYLGSVGALIEGPALWPALTAVENLRVLARLGGHDEGRIPELLDLVGLADRARDRFGTFSLGMKQRLAIAGALLGDPRLLMLDEPTNGLDPVGMAEMRDLIRRVAADDRTVLVSSHLLSELEQVCDWLVVIDRGRLVYCGDAAGFATHAGTELVLGTVNAAELQSLADVVARYGFDVVREGDRLVVPVEVDEPRRMAASLNASAAAAGLVLAELHIRRPTLERNYLRLLEGAER